MVDFDSRSNVTNNPNKELYTRDPQGHSLPNDDHTHLSKYQKKPNKELPRDPQGHSVPEDGRIYSEQLHEQIGAELFIKKVLDSTESF